MAMTTAEADKILSAGSALRAPTPGLFAEVAHDSRRLGVSPGQGRRRGRAKDRRGSCRRRPRTGLPRSPPRPSASPRKKEDGRAADFVPASGDRFGCPEPSGTDDARPPKAVADLCVSYVPRPPTPDRPTRPAAEW